MYLHIYKVHTHVYTHTYKYIHTHIQYIYVYTHTYKYIHTHIQYMHTQQVQHLNTTVVYVVMYTYITHTHIHTYM